VLVEPGVEGTDDEDVKLSVIEPAPKPTPVGVGAEGGSDASDEPHPESEADTGPAATESE
jgi:ATP-dependent Clp protease ATP-binding subunit ClpC